MIAPETALRWHLQGNLYPPIPDSFMTAAKDAIAAVKDYNGDQEIELPTGRMMTAHEIVERLHLDEFMVLDFDLVRAVVSMSVREAGRHGGQEILRRYGRDYFAEIGRRGGFARARAKRQK